MTFTNSLVQNFEGVWKGKIKDANMEILLNIKKDRDKYTSTLDMPSMGVSSIVFDKVIVNGGKIELLENNSNINISGVSKEENTLDATFYQGSNAFSIIFKKSDKLPGDTSLPSTREELEILASKDDGNFRYSVEDYFSKPKASSFSISPDGKYISYKEKDENLKNHIYIKDINTGKVSRVLEEKEELIRWYGWANENKIVYTMDRGGNEVYHLFSINIDGSDQRELTPFENVKVEFINFLKEDKEHIIIGMNKDNPHIFEPYKINICTGDIIKLYANDDTKNPIIGYDFDKDGNLRSFLKLKDGVNNIMYYAKEKNSFEVLKSLNWYDNFRIITFNYATENPHDAYVISNLDSDKTEIYLYDLKEDRVIKKIFSHDEYDVSSISLSRKRNWELDYYKYEGEKNVKIPVSDFFKKFHLDITKRFPNYDYSVIGHDDDENVFLIYIQSDKFYGAYHSYDVNTRQFKLLFTLMPQLKEEDMASMKPIKFKSRDGITINGYITLPNNYKKGHRVPLIVNPHGGPQGVRDSWGFNPEAQLFASRGYATLHVNFRVSGGYGKEFLQSGFKQIGRKCMDDIEDGIQYVMEQGWVDKDKIAIYGGSHGGYATLRGLTKTPELYACGVDYVGVSNLFTFMKSIPAYWKPYLKILKEIWYDKDVPEEKEIMRKVSPIFHVDKITKPLFVIQGANDPRVNIDESDQIVKAIRDKGINVPYMVKYDEGHGFHHEKNRLEIYRTMIGFFELHLK